VSGSIWNYSPQSKTFIPRAPDGKYSPKGPVKVNQQGVVGNNQPSSPGITVLTQIPTSNRK